jgi:hypothetical protein
MEDLKEDLKEDLMTAEDLKGDLKEDLKRAEIVVRKEDLEVLMAHHQWFRMKLTVPQKNNLKYKIKIKSISE